LNIKKGFAAVGVALATGVIVAGCSLGGGPSGAGSKANNSESQAQGQDSYNMVTNQPVPIFKTSQMRATASDVETIQANGEDTTTFFFNLGIQNPIFSCTSRGMPVPADAQLTNPDQTQWNTEGSSGVASAVTSQMDPTGVYTGATTGTNVLCLDNKGQEYIQYWEGFVDSVSGAATWNNNSHQVQLLGQPDTLPASSQIKK
jgi:hypothetical protein